MDANVLEGIEPPRTENLVEVNPPRLAPVRAVRGPRHVLVIVARVLAAGMQRPGREDGVVGFQELLRHFRRRRHHHRPGPEFQEHQVSVFLGERVERLVWDGAQEV